jgi:hypothetical protein
LSVWAEHRCPESSQIFELLLPLYKREMKIGICEM